MAWNNAGEIHQALERAALPICGVAFRFGGVHETQYGASFIRCEETLFRVDWQQKPTEEQKQAAAQIIGSGCEPVCDSPVLIDSSTDAYPADQAPPEPRKIADVIAYYLAPRVWVADRPTIDHSQADLTCVFDEVYRDTLASGIKVRVLRLGIFVFDFSESCYRTTSQTEFSTVDSIADLNLKRLAALNVHLLCLSSVFTNRTRLALDKHLLRPMDLLVPQGFENPHNLFTPARFHDRSVPALHELTASFFQHAAGGELLRYNAVVWWQQEGFGRPVIENEVLRESFAKFSEILGHPAEHALLLVSMIAQSCKAYEEFDYGLGLITAWAVTEKLLNVMWRNFVETKQTAKVFLRGDEAYEVDGGRKKRLLDDHRSYTASVIAEILAFQNVLPFDLYLASCIVRKARNDWMHSLKSVNKEQVGQAIELATAMLKQVEGIDLPVQPVSRVLVTPAQ